MFTDKVIGAEAFEKKHIRYIDHQVSASDKFSITFEAENETLVLKWQGKVSSQELRNGYKRVIELVKSHKPQRWILDLQQRSLIARDDQRWVFKQVFPEVLRLVQGNVFVAVILPIYTYQSLVNALDGDELMQDDNFLIMHEFLYYEEARRWLTKMLVSSERA
jgi:hypothetical protein